MLNGIDPILIFSFYKSAAEVQSSTGLTLDKASFAQKLKLPPIPLYLSEKITGLYVQTEEKNIDVETTIDGALNAEVAIYNQKPVNTSVKISLHAEKDNIALSLLCSMMDLILPKLVTANYDVTYLNGATTVFGGLIHAFSVSQESNTTLMTINLELIKVPAKATLVVGNDPTKPTLSNVAPKPATPLTGGGSAPVPPSSSSMPLRLP